MKSGKIIVVAVRDALGGKIALRRALRMAPTAEDRIRLIHVSHPDRVLDAPGRALAHSTPLDGERAPERGDWLRHLAESVGKVGPQLDFQVLDGSPGEAIADFARAAGADLIVVATHREGQVRELFIGSTALSVLRKASCPVLVARDRSVAPYRRALLAVDLDESGQRVVGAAAVWLADVALDLLHVYRYPHEGAQQMRGVQSDEIEPLRVMVRDEIEQRIAFLAAAFPKVVTHLQHGFPADVIFDRVLQQRPDILVLGKHRGSSSLERSLGSVTLFLLYASPTDVLLVP